MLAVVSCATRPPVLYQEPEAGQPRAAIFRERWAAYLASVDADRLQPDCRPRLYEPPPGVAYRGTVVFFHGFSACPQQFFELAELLADAGYRTVLPLLPGHGLQFDDPGGDALDGLPEAGNWRDAYDQLALAVNGLMAYADAERVIGGLSVGGSASLFVNAQARDLYDRHIVFAPFLAPGGGALAGSAAAVTARTPAVRQASVKPFGIKQPCLDKRAEGRAGFCNYPLKHVGALTSMGGELQSILGNQPLDLPLQFVGTENDGVVNNDRSREMLKAQQATGKTSACFMPAGVPHAMISAVDSPGLELYWLDALYTGAIRFVTEGEPLPTAGQISGPEAPFELCQLDIERPS